MKNFNKFIIGFFTLASIVSCSEFETSLEVENLNAPNDQILLTDATALEASASGIINNWFQLTHDNLTVGSSMAVMADAFTCSWGNYAMRDTSSEPRTAWNNSSGYSDAGMTERFFNGMHSILTDSNNLIKALDNGIQFGDEGSNNAQIEAIARFGQAISTGYLALVFDRVWISDETGALNNGDPVAYNEAIKNSLEFINKGIIVADNNTFVLPSSWINGTNYSNTDLSKLMNSMGARLMVTSLRNSSQRDALDWNQVLDYANAGISIDFAPLMDDVVWFCDLKWTLSYGGWGRVDMRIINMMDPDTQSVFPSTQITIPESTSDDARLTSDFQYLDGQDFIPSRGTYHYSSYRHSRYDQYITSWNVPVTDYSVTENDMYKAEALLRTGNVAGAATVINTGTRTSRGNLTNVAPDETEVYKAIHYERLIECANTGMGNAFFEMRKENLLQKGTLLHFPIPGSILATIGISEYTFGGEQGVAGEDYSINGWK
ncbi:MAG: hypothetical protein COB98_08965 [Flavobacteriaceae bacterium]|nr:MAG: hypothetical protein COB98_08965 [Flavobacteriaceae bacterium]